MTDINDVITDSSNSTNKDLPSSYLFYNKNISDIMQKFSLIIDFNNMAITCMN